MVQGSGAHLHFVVFFASSYFLFLSPSFQSSEEATDITWTYQAYNSNSEDLAALFVFFVS